MPVIQTKGLAKDYGKRRAIGNVNLSIDDGEIFGFLGPNGAGKSTTIRILLGFLQANEGSATIFDRDCWTDSAEIKKEVGYLPGDVRLYPWMTCNNGLSIVSKIRGVDLTASGNALAERFRLERDLPVLEAPSVLARRRWEPPKD